ncbi:MAG: hypothetical protein AMXMBFR13_27080 [Phycisphaerae bacterium]
MPSPTISHTPASSEPVLSLSYKYQRVRERLRKAIQDGELIGRLPGERELARRYNANAKTINKALTDLATEGLLIRHVGRGTFVSGALANGSSEPAIVKPLTFGFLLPRETAPGYATSLCSAIADVLREKGHELRTVPLPLEDSGALSGRDLRADMLRDWSGAVVCAARPSDELLSCLNRRHLPMVMVNNYHERLKTPTVLIDYGHGAFEICQYLIQLGHTRIELQADQGLLPAARSADIGYRAAMQRYNLRAQPMRVGDPNAATSPSLTDPTKRPTALICVGASLAVQAVQAAREPRPSDSAPPSVAAIAEPGDDRLAREAVTAYEVLPERIVCWVAELLSSASAGRPPRTIIVPGQVHERGSATPPAHPATLADSREVSTV